MVKTAKTILNTVDCLQYTPSFSVVLVSIKILPSVCELIMFDCLLDDIRGKSVLLVWQVNAPWSSV